MPSLPQHLESVVSVAWNITSWCNYSCEYCPALLFRTRSKNGAPQEHAFDHYPAERWVEALRQFPQERIHLVITGGEPFVDRLNLRSVLDGITQDERFTCRIDTNGSWDPRFFRRIDKRRILLDVAFHPSQTTLPSFRRRLGRIQDEGFQVTMVNFVLAPENMQEFEEAVGSFEEDGFFVNVAPMMSRGIYLNRKIRDEKEIEILRRYNSPIDLHYRVGNPPTKGRPCFYPALHYHLKSDGLIQVACLGRSQNLFTDGPPPLPREAVPCPHNQCFGCVDMYRSLADEPQAPKPVGLYTLDEYVRDTQAYRRQFQRDSKLGGVPSPNRWAGPESDPPRRGDEPSLIPADAIRPALPKGAVFGTLDRPGGGIIEKRGRDRVALSGWAASREHGAPVQEIRLQVQRHRLGVVRYFQDRPEIASRFGRPELLRCGWRAMVYLPALRPGEYEIRGVGVAPDGTSGVVGTVPLRILQ